MPGDIFRGRIDFIEGRHLIEKLVIEGLNHALDDFFQMDKIIEEADGIEAGASESDTDAVIVAVSVLAFTLVAAERVSRAEGFVDADFVHGLPFEGSCACGPFALRSRDSGLLEESSDFSEILRHGVLGQRFEKNFTILHAMNAVIEQGEDSAICF